MPEPLTTSHLCKSVGVTRGQLRLYEREGLLLEPARTSAGYRHYTSDTPDRLNAIKQLKEIGFTLAEISALLSERDNGEIDEARIQATAKSLVTTIDQRVARLHVVREFVAAVGDGNMRDEQPRLPISPAISLGEQIATHAKRETSKSQAHSSLDFFTYCF
jgi:MerR family transcriptional regulator, copper efflux regulator